MSKIARCIWETVMDSDHENLHIVIEIKVPSGRNCRMSNKKYKIKFV